MTSRPCFVFCMLTGFLLVSSASSEEQFDPLCTIQYCLPFESVDAYQASVDEFTTNAISLVESASKKKRAANYIALGELFERNIGHHDVTFEIYEQAIEYANGTKQQEKIEVAAREGLERLILSKFNVLRHDLVLPFLPKDGSAELLLVMDSQMDQEVVKQWILEAQEQATKQHQEIDQALEQFEHEISVARGNASEIPQRIKELKTQQARLEAKKMVTFRRFEIETDLAAKTATYRKMLGFPHLYGFHGKKLVLCADQFNIDDKLTRECGSKGNGVQGIVLSLSRYLLSSTAVPMKKEEARGLSERLGYENLVRTKDWRLEKKTDQPQFYSLSERLGILDRFITKHPEYQERGKLLVDDIMFAHAVQEDRLVLFQEYLATFAEPKHRDEALVHIERKYWEQAQREDTLEAFAAFEERYPDTRYRTELDTAIERLDFVAAKKSGEVKQLLGHLKKYPNGAFSKDAEGEIDRLRFVAVRNTNTIAGYQAFMKKYPESKFLTDCEKGIEAIKAGESFNVARKKNTSAAFESFLNEYPDSAYAPEAKAMIAFFRAKGSKTLADAETFFDLYHQVQVKRVVQSEYVSVLQTVVDHQQDNKAATNILLHEELWDRDHYFSRLSEFRQKFGEARLLSEIFALATDATQQLYALRRIEPERTPNIFSPQLVGQDGSAREGSAGLFDTVTVRTLEPELALSFTGVPELLGNYTITAQLEMDIRYERHWQGMFGVPLSAIDDRPREYTETFVAKSRFTLTPNQVTSPVWFEFPRIEQSRCKEGVTLFIGSCKRGTPIGQRLKFVSVDLAQ